VTDHSSCQAERLARRSVAATLAFVLAGSITATVVHGESAFPPGSLDWSLGDFASTFAVAQVSLSLASLCLHKAVSTPDRPPDRAELN